MLSLNEILTCDGYCVNHRWVMALEVSMAKDDDRDVMIATRVSRSERATIGAAASLGGQNISGFLRDLAVPAAARELEKAARKMVGDSSLKAV